MWLQTCRLGECARDTSFSFSFATFHSLTHSLTLDRSVFGELTFLVGGGASATITAGEGGCSITFVERNTLQTLFDSNPMLAGKFYKFLALTLNARLREREYELLAKVN